MEHSQAVVPGDSLLHVLGLLSACDLAVLNALEERGGGSIAEAAARTGYPEAEVEASFALLQGFGVIHG